MSTSTLFVLDNDETLTDGAPFHPILRTLREELLSPITGLTGDELHEHLGELRRKHCVDSFLQAAVVEYRLNLADAVAKTYDRLPYDTITLDMSVGTVVMLQHLKSPKIVLTNNPTTYAYAVLSRCGLTKFIKEICGLEPLGWPHPMKPNAAVFKWIADRYPHMNNFVLVDDMAKNVRAARQNGWEGYVYCGGGADPEDQPAIGELTELLTLGY